MLVKLLKSNLELRGRNFTIRFSDNTSKICSIDQTTTNVMNGYVWMYAAFNECGFGAYSEENSRVIFNQTVTVSFPNSRLLYVYREEDQVYYLKCRKTNTLVEFVTKFNVTMERRTKTKGISIQHHTLCARMWTSFSGPF